MSDVFDNTVGSMGGSSYRQPPPEAALQSEHIVDPLQSCCLVNAQVSVEPSFEAPDLGARLKIS